MEYLILFFFSTQSFLDIILQNYLSYVILLSIVIFTCIHNGLKNNKSINIHFFLSFFFGPQTWHIEVPRLGVESELQLPAYATATATQDPSCVCDLHHSSWQHQILDPLSEPRNQTCVLMNASQICFHSTTMGTPNLFLFKRKIPYTY